MQDQFNSISSMRSTHSALSLALFAALSVQPLSVLASTDDVEFDTQAMKARGIDPNVAEWFRQAPRFMPGESTVLLTVNGSGRGKVKARFDEQGQLCADKNFQRQAGLMPPPNFREDDTCFDLKTSWPQTELSLNPGEERVDLVVPHQAVAILGSESGNWDHGGFAGMLNYDAQYMDSSGSTGVNFMQLSTEAGVNLSDWIVRSRQTFTRFNDENSLQHQAAYAQRSFAYVKKVFQFGQINLSNSMFGTGQVVGVQMFPESALLRNRGGAGVVEGIADSQSVVEVRQSGVLIYSTTVPAGPFRLDGFSLLNTRSDLDVTLTGSNGERRQFRVPASAFLSNGVVVAPGLSFGVGKLDQQGNNEAPVLGTIANGWVLNPYTILNGGLLASTPYRAGALGVNSQLFDATMLTLQTTIAKDEKHDNKGMAAVTTLSQQVTERISLNVNASHQTQGYLELSDALQEEKIDKNSRMRNQYGGGIGWADESLGSFSLSAARSRSFDGSVTNYLRGGWSKQFGSAYVGASIEHDTGGRDTESENRFYLTVNFPLGNGRSVSSYINSASKGSRAGVRYNDRTSQDRGWSLSSDRDLRHRSTTNTGTMDLVTPFSQLSGSLTHNSDNNTTWSARASGGIVAHDSGVTMSPYRISDTFGIAKVGDEAGVRLDTPAGPTWTNGRGYAVLPSLNGYKRSTIQVDTRSLAKNVDIGNAWQETESARGSVSYINFDVIRTRRVLVDVKDTQGKPLPQSASVFDDAGNFITVVGSQGSIFIPDSSNSDKYEVQASGNTICSFTLSLPQIADMSGLYEKASAVCR